MLLHSASPDPPWISFPSKTQKLRTWSSAQLSRSGLELQTSNPSPSCPNCTPREPRSTKEAIAATLHLHPRAAVPFEFVQLGRKRPPLQLREEIRPDKESITRSGRLCAAPRCAAYFASNLLSSPASAWACAAVRNHPSFYCRGHGRTFAFLFPCPRRFFSAGPLCRFDHTRTTLRSAISCIVQVWRMRKWRPSNLNCFTPNLTFNLPDRGREPGQDAVEKAGQRLGTPASRTRIVLAAAKKELGPRAVRENFRTLSRVLVA